MTGEEGGGGDGSQGLWNSSLCDGNITDGSTAQLLQAPCSHLPTCINLNPYPPHQLALSPHPSFYPSIFLPSPLPHTCTPCPPRSSEPQTAPSPSPTQQRQQQQQRGREQEEEGQKL